MRSKLHMSRIESLGNRRAALNIRRSILQETTESIKCTSSRSCRITGIAYNVCRSESTIGETRLLGRREAPAESTTARA
jgi:hypothetical protein